ncbi:MAG TPA: hypothetical protein VGS21_02885, partial [Acidimicrobiales bacterium]|nr:hypothetical protein [Acidimicrobiales bacterium]
MAVAIVAILTVTLPVAPELWLPAIAAVLLLCLADLSRVAAAPVVRREVRTSVVRGAAERLTVDVVGSAAAGRIRIRQPITPAMRLEP